MRELIRIVQAHMDEYGVSEAEVARRIGATPQTVNQWRNGELKQLPRQKYLQALAELTRTDYVTVLSAALVDANYITEPLTRSYVVGSIDFGPLIAGLAVDADDLHTVAQNLDTLMDTSIDAEDIDEVESLISNAETLVSDANDLVSEVDDFVEAVQDVAKKVVGDPERLRRMKRETKRFRRQQARSSNLDLLAQVEHERTDPYYGPGKATAGPAGAEAAMNARARKSQLKPTKHSRADDAAPAIEVNSARSPRKAGNISDIQVRMSGPTASWDSFDDQIMKILGDAASIDPALDFRTEIEQLRAAIAPSLDTPMGRMQYVRSVQEILGRTRDKIRLYSTDPDLMRSIDSMIGDAQDYANSEPLAARTEPGYRKGQAEQGEAGGEENQDSLGEGF